MKSFIYKQGHFIVIQKIIQLGDYMKDQLEIENSETKISENQYRDLKLENEVLKEENKLLKDELANDYKSKIEEISQLEEENKLARENYEWHKSIEICYQLLNLKPESVEYKLKLAEAYKNIMENDFAIEICDEIIKDPLTDEKYLNIALHHKGLALINSGRHDEAQTILDRITDIRIRESGFIRLWDSLEDHEKIIEYGKDELEKNPENPMLLEAMVVAYCKLDNIEMAEHYFNELESMTELNMTSKFVLLLQLNKYKRIVYEYENMLENKIIDPDNLNNLIEFSVAISYTILEEKENALGMMDNESADEEYELEKLRFKAGIHYENNNFEQAYETLKKILAYDMENIPTILTLAEIAIILKRYDESAEYIRMAEDLGHNDKKLYALKALIHFELGEIDEGIRYRLLSLDEDDEYERDYVLDYAEDFMLGGDSERAENILEIYEKHFPEEIQVHLIRIRYYKSINLFELAEEEFIKLCAKDDYFLGHYDHIGYLKKDDHY